MEDVKESDTYNDSTSCSSDDNAIDDNIDANSPNDSSESSDCDEDSIGSHSSSAMPYDGDDSRSDSAAYMPLHERIRKQEEQGVRLYESRQRKAQALKLASQRLTEMRETKKRKAEGNAYDDAKTSGDGSKKKKKSKHRPTEVSSKRADFFRRGAPALNENGVGVEIGANRYKPIDPRVSNLTGHFNEEQFQKNYAFLEEMRNQEIGQTRKRIEAYKTKGSRGKRLRRKLGIDCSSPSGMEEEEARLKALIQERSSLERRKIERLAKQTVKRKVREDVESGLRGAYFLKRKEKKLLEMEEKFKELQKRGGKKAVEKILAKKRQKNKSRDAGIFAK